MLPIKDIENLVKKEKENTESIIHDFGHLKRTALGAKWFVRVLGGSKEEEDLAYIAGLLHDIVRPNTEKICHAEASAKRSREILEYFRIDPEIIERIVLAVKDHRKPVEWRDPLHQSVFLADKIFEQMGAYVIFRRAYYIGECVDFAEKPFRESIIEHFRKRLEKFRPEVFPERFRKLVDYQYNWVTGFFDSFQNGKEWSIRLARFCFDVGRTHSMLLEECIKRYEPYEQHGEKIKEETVKYLEGKKFREFEEMV